MEAVSCWARLTWTSSPWGAELWTLTAVPVGTSGVVGRDTPSRILRQGGLWPLTFLELRTGLWQGAAVGGQLWRWQGKAYHDNGDDESHDIDDEGHDDINHVHSPGVCPP